MYRFLQSIGSPLGLLGAFVFVICLPTAASFGQLRPTSNTEHPMSNLQAEAGTPRTAQAAKERLSCTEMSTQADARPSHSVTLFPGYNIYRRDKTSTTFGKINQKPVAGTNCIDYFVQVGHTYYYYVVTSDRPGLRESASSNIATVPISPQYPFSQTRSPNHTSGFLA